jgi:hypothetical protein
VISDEALMLEFQRGSRPVLEEPHLQLAPFSIASRMRNAAVKGYRSLLDAVAAALVFLL